MATGKTNVRWLRMFVDEIDLSGDSRQVGTFGVTYDTANVEGWTASVKHVTFGQVSHILTGYQAVFNNTVLLGSHIELSAVEEYVVSVLLGIQAAPAVGDPAFLSSFEQVSYVVDGEGPVLITADFAKAITDQDHEKAFGVVLEAGDTSRSATLTGANVDNLGSSANGAMAHLHVTVSSGGSWTMKVQDSPDNSVWADLITFASDGSAITAESGDVAGTVDQHTRALFTRTSGSLTACCTIVRQ